MSFRARSVRKAPSPVKSRIDRSVLPDLECQALHSKTPAHHAPSHRPMQCQHPEVFSPSAFIQRFPPQSSSFFARQIRWQTKRMRSPGPSLAVLFTPAQRSTDGYRRPPALRVHCLSQRAILVLPCHISTHLQLRLGSYPPQHPSASPSQLDWSLKLGRPRPRVVPGLSSEGRHARPSEGDLRRPRRLEQPGPESCG